MGLNCSTVALPILEFILALVEEQSSKGCNLAIRRLEVWCIFGKPFAQLCVHRTVLRLIEGLFENLQRDKIFKIEI